MTSLDQVVTEDLIVGKHCFQCLLKGRQLVDSLSGKIPLAKQILVHVRSAGDVRIDAGAVGHDAREPRPVSASQMDIDTWLEDDVSAIDALRISEVRPVERVCQRPN